MKGLLGIMEPEKSFWNGLGNICLIEMYSGFRGGYWIMPWLKWGIFATSHRRSWKVGINRRPYLIEWQFCN
jgi:hypothetical protein